jgi:hypothetical protein
VNDVCGCDTMMMMMMFGYNPSMLDASSKIKFYSIKTMKNVKRSRVYCTAQRAQESVQEKKYVNMAVSAEKYRYVYKFYALSSINLRELFQ